LVPAPVLLPKPFDPEDLLREAARLIAASSGRSPSGE